MLMKKLYTLLAAAAMVSSAAFAQAPENLYLMGNTKENAWNPTSSYAFTNNGNGVFTIEGVELNDATSYFTFVNVQNSDWNVINDGTHRYGPATSGTAFSLDEANEVILGGDVSWTLPKGTYSFKVDFNTMTATANGLAGEDGPTDEPGDEVVNLFVIGSNVDGEEWATGTNQMTFDESTGNYTWTGKYLASGFKINNGGWSNAEYNIGAASDTDYLTIGTPFKYTASGDSKNINFNEVDDVVDPVVIINLTQGTILVTDVAAVHSISTDISKAEVIYNLQGVRVNRESMTPGIYIVNGKKVVLK